MRRAELNEAYEEIMYMDRKDSIRRQTEALRCLERTNMLRCLLYIDGNGPVLRTDIYRDVAGGQAMMENLRGLFDLGLIDYFESTVRGCEFIALTERGRSTVTALRLMLEIASEEIPTR